jgi:hypothetical protein
MVAFNPDNIACIISPTLCEVAAEEEDTLEGGREPEVDDDAEDEDDGGGMVDEPEDVELGLIPKIPCNIPAGFCRTDVKIL